MTSSASTTTPAKLGFQERVTHAKIVKSDINALILDYLTMEGFPKAAAKFSKEANLTPLHDNEFVRTRQKIRNAIHLGNIEEAITSLNHFNPEILDHDPTLHFALLRLQLVELIRNCGRNGNDFKPIIKFAQEQLAPQASIRKDFLAQLEETMVMLFFVPGKMPAAQQKLLSPDLRREVADMANRMMIFHHSRRVDSAIRRLVKMRTWTENTARDNQEDIPESINIGLHIPGESKNKDHEQDAMVTN